MVITLQSQFQSKIMFRHTRFHIFKLELIDSLINISICLFNFLQKNVAHVGCARATEQPISVRLRWSHTDIDGPTSFTLRPPHSLPTDIKTSKYALSPLCMSIVSHFLSHLISLSLIKVLYQLLVKRRGGEGRRF